MDDKKEQILQAAMDCFTTYGYEKTSMSDIGSRVGLNKASLYYHFKDKLSLFDTMVQSKRALHRERLRSLIQEQSPGITQILDFLCAEIDFIQELALNFLAAPSKNTGGRDDTSPVYQVIIEEDIRLLTGMIQSAVEQDLFPGVNPAELAPVVLHTARALLLVDCPLEKPLDQRQEGYDKVRSDIRNIVGLMLIGAGG